MMAAWRRKALEVFPELRRELNHSDYSCYSLFSDLRVLLRQAHEGSDSDGLKRIYGFAEYCLNHPNEDIQNAVGVSFYEHVFAELPKGWWVDIVKWLSKDASTIALVLSENTMDKKALREFEKFVRQELTSRK